MRAVVTIVPSESRHREDINRLTLVSKAHWGYSDELMALWHDGLVMTPQDFATFDVHHAEDDGHIVGVYALDDPPIELVSLFVAPSHIGSGVGSLLFRHAADNARSKGASGLLVESDPNAVGFYERMGCVVVGDRPSIPEGRRLPLLRIDLSSPS